MVPFHQPAKCGQPRNLVQVGIGGWQVPREGVAVARERETNIITMSDMERMGVDKTAEMALEMAWDGVDMVYMVPSTSTVSTAVSFPAPGGPNLAGSCPVRRCRLPRKSPPRGFAAWNWSRLPPPYDQSENHRIDGATRVIVDVLGSLVSSGKMGAHKRHIDKPVAIPHGEFEGKRWSNAT